SDRFRLMLYDRQNGTSRELSTGFDRWVSDLIWSPDSQRLFLTVEDRGRDAIFQAPTNGDKFEKIISESTNTGITVSADGKTLAFTRPSLQVTAEVFKANPNGSGVTQLTQTNALLLSQLELNPADEFEFDGAKTPAIRSAKIGKLKASTDIGPGKTTKI